MHVFFFSSIVCLVSILAGLLGALTGLGGGVVIVPVLCLLFNVDLHYAIGASLVSVIATSSGAAAAYVRDGYSNIRIGMFLEMATMLGALLGAYLTAIVAGRWIGMIFGLVLLYSAWASLHGRPDQSRSPQGNPSRDQAESARLLPCEWWPRIVRRRPHPRGIRDYVHRRHLVGIAWNWFRCGQGSCHGSGDEVAIQGFDDHEQLYDRRYRRRKRGTVFQSWLHRSGARHASGAWGSGRFARRLPHSHEYASKGIAVDLQHRHCRPWS